MFFFDFFEMNSESYWYWLILDTHNSTPMNYENCVGIQFPPTPTTTFARSIPRIQPNQQSARYTSRTKLATLAIWEEEKKKSKDKTQELLAPPRLGGFQECGESGHTCAISSARPGRDYGGGWCWWIECLGAASQWAKQKEEKVRQWTCAEGSYQRGSIQWRNWETFCQIPGGNFWHGECCTPGSCVDEAWQEPSGAGLKSSRGRALCSCSRRQTEPFWTWTMWRSVWGPALCICLPLAFRIWSTKRFFFNALNALDPPLRSKLPVKLRNLFRHLLHAKDFCVGSVWFKTMTSYSAWLENYRASLLKRHWFHLDWTGPESIH